MSALTRLPEVPGGGSGHAPPPPPSGCDGAPTANDDAYSVVHDRVLSVAAPGVLANDTDPNGCGLTPMKLTDPSNGSVVFNSDGSFTYTPYAHFVGTDSFTYYDTNGTYNSNTATVTITVTHNQTLYVDAPGVLGNDYDPDMDPLTAHWTSGPYFGVLDFHPDGSFSYTPIPTFTGSDSFTYQPFDGVAYGNSTAVTISATGNQPIANYDEFATAINQTLTVPTPGVLASDFSPAGRRPAHSGTRGLARQRHRDAYSSTAPSSTPQIRTSAATIRSAAP